MAISRIGGEVSEIRYEFAGRSKSRRRPAIVDHFTRVAGTMDLTIDQFGRVLRESHEIVECEDE